jgi:large subunit ribosomal protein L24e
MPRNRECDYCSADIEPGTGTMLVRTDGTTIHYCSSKCESNANLGREARDLEWASEDDRAAADEAGEAETEDASVEDEAEADESDEDEESDSAADADEAEEADEDTESDADEADADEADEGAEEEEAEA